MLNTAQKRLLSTARPVAPDRRHVSPQRVRAPVRHLALPGHELDSATFEVGETIESFLKRTEWASRARRKWSFKLPTICVLNGKPLLQRAWGRRRIKAGDVLEFWSKPLGGSRGGGSKSVLGLVAIVALAAFAPWAGGALAGSLGLGSVAASAFSAVITIGGALLISALTAPRPGGQNDQQQINIDPIYSVSAGGNAARLLQPIPVQYGRVKSFPDYAITPWSEFEGNDQYLNVLLHTALGRYDYETLYLDDTILWTKDDGVSDTFDNVTIEFYDPNATVTLFPVNVVQATEVSGQTITTDGVGGYIANESGTTATALAVDMVFPSGCFTIGGDGALVTSSVTVTAQYRPVDAAGAPIGSYSDLFSKTYTFATRNPQRVTEKVNVPAGRYEVKVSRGDAEISGTGGSNTVAWAGLRAFINGPNSFPGSTVGIRIKANDQLTQGSAKKFGVLCTRILPVWDSGTGAFVDQATRSPAWAFYDAAVDTDYGASRPPSKLDFQSVYDLATDAESRGDKFDFRFVTAVAVPNCFDTILRSTRARHRWSGDILTLVRDEWSDTPRMLLTDQEIIRNSLSLDYALNTDDSADAVVIEYLDENTWNPAEVQYPPNSESFTSEQATRIRVDGVVNRDHAYREAAFYYLCAQLRRVGVTLDTEHDGRMLGYGSRVRIQTSLPQSWGYSGRIVANDGAALTLSPAPTWAATGTHYIAIRNKTGRQFGPVACSKGIADEVCILNSTDLVNVESAQGTTLSDALARRDGAELPSFDFGVGTQRARSCLVVSGRPNGDRVTLKLIVDDENVHSTSLGSTPVQTDPFPLKDVGTPNISGVIANFRQGIAEPILDASWPPAQGAVYYLAEVSYDSGVTWTPVYEGAASVFSIRVEPKDLLLQVSGVGNQRGAWKQIAVIAPAFAIESASLSDEIQRRLTALEDIITSLASLDDVRGRQSSGQIITSVRKTLNDLSVAAMDTSVRLEEVDAAQGSKLAQAQEAIYARIDSDGAAVAGQILSLQATDAVNSADIVAESTARVAADSSLTTQVTAAQSTANGAVASIASEATTRASADGALSTSIIAAQSQLDTATASGRMQLTTVASPKTGVAAEFSIDLRLSTTVSFVQSGFRVRINNDGTSTALIRANNFIISSGTSTDGSGNDYTPFAITVNGLESNAVLNGNLLVAGTVTADKMNVNELTAITAHFGSAVVDGTLTSPNGKLVIDFSNNRIIGYA